MAKDNDALSLYRAQRDQARQCADAALTKAVASVTKKAGCGGKSGKQQTVVEEVSSVDEAPDVPQKDIQPDAQPVK